MPLRTLWSAYHIHPSFKAGPGFEAKDALVVVVGPSIPRVLQGSMLQVAASSPGMQVEHSLCCLLLFADGPPCLNTRLFNVGLFLSKLGLEAHGFT